MRHACVRALSAAPGCSVSPPSQREANHGGPTLEEKIMKTIVSALVALSVLAAMSATAGATFKPSNTKQVFKDLEKKNPF
jgi:hypothetical protein